MTALGRSRSLQGSSGSLLLRDAQGKPFLAPGISGLQHFRSGFTLRGTLHDLPQLRSPSRGPWLLYFRSFGLTLAFNSWVLLVILYRLNSLSFVIGLHTPKLLENC